MSDLKPINHLFETAHNFNDGVNTAVNLVTTEWSHFTVTDGDWMTQNTLKPLYWRDMFLANTIDDYAHQRLNFLTAGVGIIITDNYDVYSQTLTSHTINYNNLSKPITDNYPIVYTATPNTGTFSLAYDTTEKRIGLYSTIKLGMDYSLYVYPSTTLEKDKILLHCKKITDNSDVFVDWGRTPTLMELTMWSYMNSGNSAVVQPPTFNGGITAFPANANVVVVSTNKNKLYWTEHSSEYKDKRYTLNGVETQYPDPTSSTFDCEDYEIDLGDWNIGNRNVSYGMPLTDNSINVSLNYENGNVNFVPDEVLFIY